MAQRIGELNGRWAILLKVTLVAVPAFTTLMLASFLPWAVWVTGNIYRSQDHKNRIVLTESEMKQNSVDHTQIKVMLGGIQAKLDTIHPSGGGT